MVCKWTFISTVSGAVSFDVHRHNWRIIASYDNIVFLICFLLGISKGTIVILLFFNLLSDRIFVSLFLTSIALAYFDILILWNLLLTIAHLYLHWCQTCRLITRFTIKLRTLMNTDAQSILSILIYATPNRQISPSVMWRSPTFLRLSSLNNRGFSLFIRSIMAFVE